MKDVQTRFFHKLSSLTDTPAEHLCDVDYENEMAFAVVVGPPEHERRSDRHHGRKACVRYACSSSSFPKVPVDDWLGSGRTETRLVADAIG